jgi:type II secretory pathway component PulM
MMERLQAALDALRTYWENLTPRERFGMSVIGGMLAVLAVVVPVWLASSSIGELEDDNEEIMATLRRIQRSRGQIAAAQAEQAERDARYAMGVPGDDFLTAQAQRQSLALSRVQSEPERAAGRFRIKTTRAQFQSVGLRPVMLLLAELENSRYPIAIERIHVDHHAAGDRYNIEVGVQMFERPGAARTGLDAGVPRPAARPGARTTAGPPPR